MLSDKITNLRKRQGWSQEEFADRLNVSRQAVSKWESGQSVPELDKILQMSELFHVTTDQLLKDETVPVAEEPSVTTENNDSFPTVSKEECADLLSKRKVSCRYYAIATFLCVTSPIALILLSALAAISEHPMLSEVAAVSIGMIVLLVFIAVAVGLYIYGNQYCPMPNDVPDDEAARFLQEQLHNIAPRKNRNTLIGTILCIISIVPLFAVLPMENDLAVILSLCTLLFLVAIATVFFITTGCVASMIDRLIKRKETGCNDEESSVIGIVSKAYWMIATATYLLWSFLSGAWASTWIVWPIAGVLFPVVMSILYFIPKK